VSAPRRKKPSGPPPSVGVLAKYAQAYAREAGVTEGRVRAWLAYMVLAGILERFAGENNGYQFTIKGGVALELRLKDRARATKDIDLVLHDSVADLARAFERALERTTEPAPDALSSAERSSYQGFEFQRKREPLIWRTAPSTSNWR
jgi:Nucleotidyl transferase AbiEii toxin, Type IV TA system